MTANLTFTCQFVCVFSGRLVYDRLLEKAQYFPPGSTKPVRLPCELSFQLFLFQFNKYWKNLSAHARDATVSASSQQK